MLILHWRIPVSSTVWQNLSTDWKMWLNYSVSFQYKHTYICYHPYHNYISLDQVDIWCHWCHINVDATSSRHIDVNTKSFLRHVPAGVVLRWVTKYVYVVEIKKKYSKLLCHAIFTLRGTFFSIWFLLLTLFDCVYDSSRTEVWYLRFLVVFASVG